eukprot:8176655-Karenia_brevis.AAC.1
MFIRGFVHVLTQFDDRCAAAGLTSTFDSSGAADFFEFSQLPATYTAQSIAYVDAIFKPIFCSAHDVVSA